MVRSSDHMMAMAMINDDSDAELSINLPTQEQRMLSQVQVFVETVMQRMLVMI